MKKITQKYQFIFLFVGIGMFLSSSAIAQTVQLHQATFETGNDGWTLVNTATRTNTASYSYENNWSMQVGGTADEIQSPTFALAAYNKVEVQFFAINRGMDTNEYVYLDYRPDGSTAWQTVNRYRSGIVSSKNADFQYNSSSSVAYAKTISISSADFTFPAAATAQFRFRIVADNATDLLHLDLITITGTTYTTAFAEAPGGVDSNLALWLRADKVDGSGVATDNTGLTSWTDNGRGDHAGTVLNTQAPTYKNNSTDNINFNPVVEFSNSSATSTSDMTYLTARDEMAGSAGFYSHDIFVVLTPDEPITNTMIPLDTFTGKDPTGTTAQEDVTGFGYGAYTNRFVDEYFAYCIGTTNGPGNGYGKGDIDFTLDLNQVGIINARHNATSGATGQNVYFNNIEIAEDESDAADFAEISNQKFYLGRSQYWNGSFGGRIAEVITYSATNNDASAAADRNKIQSYLAIKYGITLGVNGTSQDYVDSSGNVIWDQSSDAAAFNYDIAGIGRSDAAGLMQKQSKSINSTGLVTMGITEIVGTNSDNSNTVTIDESYLVWGNDNGALTAAPTINVDMSAGISGLSTMVDFTSISRTWKVVETGGDVPEVAVSIPEITLSATLTPPGRYLMFVSSTPSFSPTSEYRVMDLNGANLEANYDFNGTKYITFGYAPQYIYERSITFDGSNDYLDADDIADLNGAFTMSAWIMSDSGNSDVDIISKRNESPYNEGYAFRINNSRRLEAFWKDSSGSTESITSSTRIGDYPDEWHHVAIIFDGSTAKLYIDGVEDGSESLNAPRSNSLHFMIGAADYLSPTDHFDGTIDEVRLWRRALSVDQLRFIMNQEIEEHSDNSATGSILPQAITKNEVSSLDWPDLVVYYPMNVYTFTNVNDNSGNNNVAAIRNLDTVDFQTAPLPYESQADGDWDSDGTWLNNAVQNLPQELSIVDGTTLIEWNIVDIDHDLQADANTTVLGAMINASAELILSNDNKFEVTHYLSLDGFMDLQGESQLVQTSGSWLKTNSVGYLEADQAGTADNYTYNYWSSPVGRTGFNTLNNAYKINNRLRDGTTPETPINVDWTWGLDGFAGTPITLSAVWIYKFENRPIGDYDSWEFVGPYQYFGVGQGFTMKGSGTGGVSDLQNYTFTGKPNNDQTGNEVSLSIDAGNNYLIGNPFPSALDADDFIADNPDLDGSLYFWEHWGGNSHELAEYQGGYAIYNLSGGVPATSHPMVSDAGLATKTPGRYVPVAQGFFVAADNSGTINFDNGQRNFVKLGGSSVFMFADNTYSDSAKSGGIDLLDGEPDDTQFDAPDLRTKLRVGFESPKGLQRQLLLTFDDNTTLGYDRSYDGKVFDEQIEDMNWLIDDSRYAIQGIPTFTGEARISLPLRIHIDQYGEFTIGLDAAENIGEKLVPYFHDKVNDIYVDLRDDNYTGILEPGVYETQFELVLQKTPRNGNEINTATPAAVAVAAFHSKNAQQVTVYSKDETTSINAVSVYSIIGQEVGTFQFQGDLASVQFGSSDLATGTYILRVQTDTGIETTKIIIEK